MRQRPTLATFTVKMVCVHRHAYTRNSMRKTLPEQDEHNNTGAVVPLFFAVMYTRAGTVNNPTLIFTRRGGTEIPVPAARGSAEGKALLSRHVKSISWRRENCSVGPSCWFDSGNTFPPGWGPTTKCSGRALSHRRFPKFSMGIHVRSD